ncbi:MAG: hypothetical protein IJC85_01890 [Oscillospiraceae bacterium]|nr:hypothetical protein [Oscillospiraceae bacterium]
MRLLAFGEILFDCYPDKRFLGGAPLNLAAHAVRCGAEAFLLSAVGKDKAGREAIRGAKAFGVRTDFIQTVPDFPTGYCQITLDENALPSYDLAEHVAYDHIPLPTFDRDARFDLLSFGTLALREEDNRRTLKKLLDLCVCQEVFVDLNLRPPFDSEEAVCFALKQATILKINREEAEVLADLFSLEQTKGIEALLTQLQEKFPRLKLLLLTLGAEGSAAFDAVNGQFFTAKAIPARLVSTVGAGDSYSASFLTRLFAGASIPDAMDFASEVSAHVVSFPEAVPNQIPDFI